MVKKQICATNIPTPSDEFCILDNKGPAAIIKKIKRTTTIPWMLLMAVVNCRQAIGPAAQPGKPRRPPCHVRLDYHAAGAPAALEHGVAFLAGD